MAETNNPRLIPAAKWDKFHEWPTVGGLRWLIFHEKKNGLCKAVKRVGSRVLIDEVKFFEWVEEQNTAQVRRLG